jgi:hypothetical protein
MFTERTSLAVPLRWLGSDFATSSGQARLIAKVRHVLLCDGEMPWRTALRSGIEPHRHRRTDAVTTEIVRVRVRDALKRWLPEVETLRVEVTAVDTTLVVRVDVREGDVHASVGLELA